MYDTTAEYYDEIFPLSQAQHSLVAELTPPGGRVLDVGCATGALCAGLAQAGYRAVGFDADPILIEHAVRRASGASLGGSRHHRDHGEHSPSPSFFVGKMEELHTFFDERSFDSVVCLGNTLVHGDGVSGITDILTKIYRVLKPGGHLLLQLLNYRRILADGVTELPPIETERVRFERFYRQRHDGFLSFHTVLTVKETAESAAGSVRLYPLTKDELEGVLRSIGFVSEVSYGDYERAPFSDASFLLLLVARRPPADPVCTPGQPNPR